MLTNEQITLGQIYLWIHNRAEYLRKQKASSVNAGRQSTEEATGDKTGNEDNTSVLEMRKNSQTI